MGRESGFQLICVGKSEFEFANELPMLADQLSKPGTVYETPKSKSKTKIKRVISSESQNYDASFRISLPLILPETVRWHRLSVNIMTSKVSQDSDLFQLGYNVKRWPSDDSILITF